MKKYATLLFILFLSCAFLWPKKKTITPPGTFEVSENMYYDKTPITNLDWKEYMFWLEKVYGEESDAYKKARPNINVWGREYICLLQARKTYFFSKEYQKYPVVGIDQDQVHKYLEWRSNRVMQLFLINRNVIEMDTLETPESIFTIDKYFKGEYKGIQPHKRYNLYPEYRLPNMDEYKVASMNYDNYSDSIPNVPCYFDSLKYIPLDEQTKKINFNDGLSEWTVHKDTVIGKNWKKPELGELFSYRQSSNFIGFRAVCSWKSYSLEK